MCYLRLVFRLAGKGTFFAGILSPSSDAGSTSANADYVGGWIAVLLAVICSLGNRVAKEEYTHVVKERGASCQPSRPEPPTTSLNILGQSYMPTKYS